MHYDLSGSATTTTNYLGTAFLLTLVGGFISDAFMTRLNTGLLFGALEVLVKFTSHVETSIHSLLNSLLLTWPVIVGATWLLFGYIIEITFIIHQSQYNILVVANYFQKNVVLLDLLFDKILELMMSETTSMWTPKVEEDSTIKFFENSRTEFSLEEWGIYFNSLWDGL